MARDAYVKTPRILSMFMRLLHGGCIHKKAEAERFNVNEKTIQRDLDDIRTYFAEANCNGTCGELIYRRKENNYYLNTGGEKQLQGMDVLLLTKILLESRSLCKVEMESLLDKLFLQALPQDKKMIEKLVCNEKYHYAPVSHGKKLAGLVWQLSCALREQRRVQIEYKKENAKDSILREVEPQGVIFSEYYFYLLACIVGKDYDFPAVYRIDRIAAIKVLDKTFRCSYCNRFEEGEFRKRVQFMKSGPILKLIFRYTGTSLAAVLDRLPTARVIEQKIGAAVIESEVFGDGIKMWLLSQGEYVEVLKPEGFRDEMRETIGKMAGRYDLGEIEHI